MVAAVVKVVLIMVVCSVVLLDELSLASSSSLDFQLRKMSMNARSRWEKIAATNSNMTSTMELLPDYMVNSVGSQANKSFFMQTLDHFSYTPGSYQTFQQMFITGYEFWGGAKAKAPIIVLLGAESPLILQLVGTPFLAEVASTLRALLVFIEHRYYGSSIPFGGQEQAFEDTSKLGYFTSEQALADFAVLISSLKKNLSAEASPVIVVGASYGGMLASWFRLKYPHIAMGAMASSAPILYFDGVTNSDSFLSVVSIDYEKTNKECYDIIRESWSRIDKIALQPGGYHLLSQVFRTCSELNKTSLSRLKKQLETSYGSSAQYDFPGHFVAEICNAILEGGRPNGTDIDIISRISKGFFAHYQLPKGECNNIEEDISIDKYQGWAWQSCTEMVIPIGGGPNATMFPSTTPFDMNNHAKFCKELFSVVPRPHWIETEFGGQDIKKVLQNYGSNIIFSNGLRDPYSSGGVTESISKTIVAITAAEGSHCLDLAKSLPDDPAWLTKMRQDEIQVLKTWLNDYYA